MTHDRQILFVYADSRTLTDACDRAMMPATILEQAMIDPASDRIIVTRFHKITGEHDEPIVYEEFAQKEMAVVEGNAELIRRVKALCPGTFHDVPPEKA